MNTFSRLGSPTATLLGALAIVVMVPVLMTTLGGEPVSCGAAEETYWSGSHITSQDRKMPDGTDIQVCVTVPAWYRTDQATPVRITVNAVHSVPTVLLLELQTSGAATSSSSFQFGGLSWDGYEIVEPTFSADGSGDVVSELTIATRGNVVLYDATIKGPTRSGYSAFWARLRWAAGPTVGWLALYLAGLWIWRRFGRPTSLHPAAQEHYERPVLQMDL